MMFAAIFMNLLGACVAATSQSLVSSAADAARQGQTLGAVSALGSLMAVIAPLIGAPMFFGAAMQAAALVLAVVHFRSKRTAPGRASPAPT